MQTQTQVAGEREHALPPAGGGVSKRAEKGAGVESGEKGRVGRSGWRVAARGRHLSCLLLSQYSFS